MLQCGIPFVCLAEGGAALHLVDIEGAVLVLVHHVGEDKDIVVEEASLEEVYLFFFIKMHCRKRGVGVDVALQLGTEVDAVGEGGFEGVLELASTVEALHLLARVLCQARIVHVEPQGAVALQPADVLALAQ